MKRALFFLLFLPYALIGAQWEYYDAMHSTVAKRLGADFPAHEHKLVSSPSYQKLMQQLNTKVEKKVNKTTLNVLPYQEIFETLEVLRHESDSLIPSFYAYHLIRLSYGVKSDEVNKKYGLAFAKDLSTKGVCEGYVWSGLIYERDPQTWRMARDSFATAKKVCKEGSLFERAKLSYARINYLIKKQDETKEKKAK